MKLYILLILSYITKNQANWNLIWHDEFDNSTLDLNKWEILTGCDGNGIQQLECNTNSSENLRLIDGTLAITVLIQKQSNKDYTSAKIITKNSFTFGRFEIRAALPKGKLLRPTIFLSPITNSGDWPTDGQMDIITNVQTQQLGHGVHYNYPRIYKSDYYWVDQNLNDFHTYALEWTKSEIRWFFDQINYYSYNISRILGNSYTRIGQPFDEPFKLQFHLGVAGIVFGTENQFLTLEDAFGWHCSLLILDFVRIYQWIDKDIEQSNRSVNIESSDSICRTIMSKINKNPNVKSANLIVIISVISSLLLLGIIPFVIYLFVRQKKLNQINRENNPQYYDDNQNDVFYETCNEYENTYQNPYENPDKYYTKIDEKANLDVEIEQNNLDLNYLALTNDYVKTS